MKQRHRTVLIVLLILLLPTSISTLEARETTQYIAPVQWFEPNQGQIDSQFAYVAHDRGYTVFMRPTEVAYSLALPSQNGAPEEHGQMTFVNVHMQLMGAKPGTAIVGEDLLPGVSNYIKGKGSFTDIPHYGGVRYSNLYNGIDMTYYGSPDGLQYDFQVAPGADPKQIRLHFTDIERLEVSVNGDLLIHAANNSTLTHKVPYSYQVLNGLRQEVHTRYTLLDDYTVGFDVGSHDASQALVIDPPVVYSTYIGGATGSNIILGIDVDAAGNAYITGQTGSS
ncbi:MAG: hypothetical protein H0X30_32495, partial [Anaerolineae bacterium]|nr:hypothetical protein [Anaerolineae bacterium]